jgi:hypothetical protein
MVVREVEVWGWDMREEMEIGLALRQIDLELIDRVLGLIDRALMRFRIIVLRCRRRLIANN